MLETEAKNPLLSRNVTVLGKRTSIRLEQQMWCALREVADRELCSVHDICSLVAMRKRRGLTLTAAIRVFLMLYFKAAATEIGHTQAGHGRLGKLVDNKNDTKNLAQVSGM